MTLQDYVRYALERGAKCWQCRRPVNAQTLHHFEHSAGWRVDGFAELLWLYFECPSCHYETSFDKLHIKRPLPE